MWYSLFDFEYTKAELMSKPFLYKLGMNNSKFSITIFWSWILYSFWQAVLILFFVFVDSELS